MCLTKIGLVVALEGAHVRNQAGGCDLAPKECVCAKVGIDRGNGHGDMAGPNV